MKNLRIIFICILMDAPNLFAQLPMQTFTTSLNNREKVSAVLFPVIQDHSPRSLATVGYSTRISGFNYAAEVSTIERFNTSGAAIAPRANHVSAYQSVGHELGSRNNSHARVKLEASNFMIWDRTFSEVTRQWEVSGRLRFVNGKSIGLSILQRHDRVEDMFSVGRFEVGKGHHLLRNVTMRYSGNSKSRFIPYAEVVTGSYYGSAMRYAVRLGEHFKFTPKLKGFADVEFNRLVGETMAMGYLVRSNLEYTASKKISTGVFVVHNTFSQFNGVLAYAQFTKECHSLKVEYREVRIDFRFVETSHPFFASHVLLQYRYTLMN